MTRRPPKTIRRAFVAAGAAVLAAAGALLTAPDSNAGSDTKTEVVLYCGRSQSLAGPLIERYEAMTGVDVRVKYGKSSQLALALQEEGEKGRADVFWAQDAGALGAVARAGLFRELPERVTSSVLERFRPETRLWVATSGRGRVYAYAPDRVPESGRPKSVFDLTRPEWKGRVGWAPTNASFQAFVTAMRVAAGEERTEAWLLAMKENGAKPYPKNTAILQGIVAREIDLGLPNHYYLYRFKKADSKFPVEQAFFQAGDIGNLVNVAGAGILRTATHPEAAEKFVAFLLSPVAQQYFTSEVFEFPVIGGVIPGPRLLELEKNLDLAPDVSLDQLDDLAGTLALLRKVGLI